MQLLHFSREGHRFLWFEASWSPMASWSPRCFQMPPRCLPDAFQLLLSSVIPSLWFLLQWFLLHDSSSLISLLWSFELVYKETLFGVSCWGHCTKFKYSRKWAETLCKNILLRPRSASWHWVWSADHASGTRVQAKAVVEVKLHFQ